MSGDVWARPAARVACRLLDRLPAEIADRLYVTVSPAGTVSLQVDIALPLPERITHVEQVAAVLGREPEWKEFITRPGSWYFRARHAAVDGIGVEVYTHAAADEVVPLRPDLVGAA